MGDYIGISKNNFLEWMEKERERDAEVAHERKLALIRVESHALIWTGSADELTATVTRWFESGWLQAVDLQDALQKASWHFSKPDGSPVIRFQLSAPLDEEFTHSPNYQKITFRGADYDLSSYSHAPRILKVLHESHSKGEAGMTTGQIRKKANLAHNGKMYDWFRGTGLWKNLVISVGKDRYRLDLPTKTS